MVIILDAFGLVLALTLAFAVWGPDMWRWIAVQLGMRAPVDDTPRHFGFD